MGNWTQFWWEDVYWWNVDEWQFSPDTLYLAAGIIVVGLASMWGLRKLVKTLNRS